MAEYLALLQSEYPVLIFLVSLMFGLIIGSFLNVVVYRIPIMLDRDWKQQAHDILGSSTTTDNDKFNLAFPDSHCPACDHKILVWENIPLLSYAYLRGKCSACGTRIPARYPLVEFATGLLTALVILEFGVTTPGLLACVLTWGLIALALIDYDTQLLPDDITLSFMWLGLTVNYFGVWTSLADAFVGACAGYLVLWTVFQLFKLITGKDGMGYGDFKLLSMLGAWMGWQALPLIIILSSFSGALIGGTLILMGRERDNPIPFGPYLAIAGWVTLIWGEQINLSYLQFATN